MHLVDSYLCGNPTQYISALLLSLDVMMALELPHINVLSKLDLVESQGDLAFNLEYYSEVRLTALRLTFLARPMQVSRSCRLDNSKGKNPPYVLLTKRQISVNYSRS